MFTIVYTIAVITCYTCKVDKPDEDFAWRIKDVKRQGRYRMCHKAYRRQHYVANKQKYIDKAKKWDRENGKGYNRSRTYAYEYLLHNPCVDCGESDPVVLEFDHIDPSTKSFTIGNAAAQMKPLEVVKAEIAKCAVRCRNCHVRRTAENRGGFYRWYTKLKPHYKNIYQP